MFIKEIKLYIDYLKDVISDNQPPVNEKQVKYLSAFKENLENGIEYYHSMFDKLASKYAEMKANVNEELSILKQELQQLKIK